MQQKNQLIVQKQSTTDLDEVSNYFGLTYKEKRQLSQAINDYKLETENMIHLEVK